MAKRSLKNFLMTYALVAFVTTAFADVMKSGGKDSVGASKPEQRGALKKMGGKDSDILRPGALSKPVMPLDAVRVVNRQLEERRANAKQDSLLRAQSDRKSKPQDSTAVDSVKTQVSDSTNKGAK